jgi:transposase
LVDAGGLPLVVAVSAANVPDVLTLEAMIDHRPAIGGMPGHPISKPARCHADKGYDSQANRDCLRKRRINPRIARRGIESRERLGRQRWKVERSVAWFHDFKRLRTRYDRHAAIHLAFMLLAAALICWRTLTGEAF